MAVPASSLQQLDQELLFLSAEWGALTAHPREKRGCMKRINEMLDLRLILMRMQKTNRRATSGPSQLDREGVRK